jgi:hypothetical protein
LLIPDAVSVLPGAQKVLPRSQIRTPDKYFGSVEVEREVEHTTMERDSAVLDTSRAQKDRSHENSFIVFLVVEFVVGRKSTQP